MRHTEVPVVLLNHLIGNTLADDCAAQLSVFSVFHHFSLNAFPKARLDAEIVPHSPSQSFRKFGYHDYVPRIPGVAPRLQSVQDHSYLAVSHHPFLW